MAQRTECTILLSVKIVSSLCPKRNAGRESRPHWINKYPKEIIRNKHSERKNKRWISRELKMCWDKLKTARSQAELNTENDIKTNTKSFSSYPNKKRTRKEEMGSLGVALCQYSASAEVKDNPGRARALKEYFIHGTESGVLSKDEKVTE